MTDVIIEVTSKNFVEKVIKASESLPVNLVTDIYFFSELTFAISISLSLGWCINFICGSFNVIFVMHNLGCIRYDLTF